MKATKQHFEFTAKMIAAGRHHAAMLAQDNGLCDAAWIDQPFRAQADTFAEQFADGNPRFDRKRFMRACGYEWE